MTGPTSVDNGIEMPSYNVRHSIATKVAAKKTAKGYTLSDESCALCEMPLMTMNGKSECKVCPAIKKWLQRKNEADAHKEVEDMREEVEKVEGDTEIRDEAPSETMGSDEKQDADIISVEEQADEESVGCVEKSDVKTADSDESTEIASKGSDESDESLARRLENINVYNSESTEGGASTFLSRSESEESEDTDAIRARARQIILDARGRGEWGAADSNDEDDDDDQASINSPNLSTFSSESIDDDMIDERAEDIIKQARKNVQGEHDLDSPSESVLSEKLSLKESVSLGESSTGMGSDKYAIIIQSAVRRFLAQKLVLGMKSKESKEFHQNEEAMEENTDEKCDAEEHSVGSVKEKQDDNEEFNDEDAAKEDVQDDHQETDPGVTQDEAKGDVPNDVNVDMEDNQDDTSNPTAVEAKEEPVPVVQDSSFVEPSQQQEVAMSDYANTNAPAPSRGIFAQLACKFDDAVTNAMGRVHSIVTCANTETNGGYEEGFEEAFDEEQKRHVKADPHGVAAASSAGRVMYDALSPRQAKYEAQTALLSVQGWQVANVSCRGCNRNMMFRPQDGHMLCAGCDVVESQAHPTAFPSHNPYTSSYGHASHHAPPRPESAMNHIPPHPQSVANHAVSTQLYNIEMNRRLNMGWVTVNHGCPYCNSQLMRKPNDDIDQCLACGPIFTQPIQVSTPSMPMMTQIAPAMSYTPMGGYPVMGTPNASFGAMRGYQATIMGTPNASFGAMGGYQAAVMGTPNASFGAPPPPPPAPPAQNFDPREECVPTPKEQQVIVPNHNQMIQHSPMGSWVQGDDVKENAPHQASVSQQLHDAKLRIEDAKKFIMSRNTRRPSNNLPPLANNRAQMSVLTPRSSAAAMAASSPLGPKTISQTGIVQSQVNTMTPGSQAGGAYHQHLTAMGSLMSPGSDTNAKHANKMADEAASNFEKMEVRSPENETTEMISATSAGTPGTQNSGYRTPQMPGKYFFA